MARIVGIFLLVVVWAGCATPPEAEVTLGPPPGWQSDGARWWQVGLDTTGVFRDLETLQAMGVRGMDWTFTGNMPLSQRKAETEQQLIRAVKQSLVRLFRNEPEVVDSLFERFVVPKIPTVRRTGDLGADVEQFKQLGYRTISRHFREPRTIRRLVSFKTKEMGESDILVPYPDSLQARGIGGKVGLQVYINEKGEPLALEVLDPVHPVLDDLALQATIEMRWQPAYLLQVSKARPRPAWARFNVNFATPGG